MLCVMMNPEEIRTILDAALPGSDIEVVDTTGTLDHFRVRAVAAAFEGKPLIERHKMIQAPLSEHVHDGRIHALSIQALTPEQWRAKAGR